MPDDMPIHTATTGRKLREPERSRELEKREGAYEMLTAAAHKDMQPKTLRPYPPSTLRTTLQNQMERALDQGSLNMPVQHFIMEAEVAKTVEDARDMAVERISGVMRYLDNVGYKGVIWMNPIEQVYDVSSKYPFRSQDTMEKVPRYLPSVGFVPPTPYHDLINSIHTMPVHNAKQQLSYESLHNFPGLAETF